MKQKGLVRGNEEGTALVYALVALVMLTLVGIMASRTAVFELNLSGNDRAIHGMKLTSESVASVAAQMFEQLTDRECLDSEWMSPTRRARQVWLSRGHNDFMNDVPPRPVELNRAAEAYSKDIRNWDSLNSAVMVDALTNAAPAGFQNCRYQIIDMGTSGNDSLGAGNNKKSLHNMLISGLQQAGHRTCLVQIGYRRRF